MVIQSYEESVAKLKAAIDVNQEQTTQTLELNVSAEDHAKLQ